VLFLDDASVHVGEVMRKAGTDFQPPPTKVLNGKPSDAAVFLQSLQNPEIVERVRAKIQNAHVFKLPPRQSASVGWRGADWKEKVWQGTVKVVERGDLTAVLLVDKSKGSIFAVCPVKEGAVDRCVDSSRYFVLRIENANGRHMFIGVAFNERNDSFDFYTALEDSRREREMEKNPVSLDRGSGTDYGTDYSIKEGEKIKVSIPKTAVGRDKKHANTPLSPKPLLRPSLRDTPGRGGVESPLTTTSREALEKKPLDSFLDFEPGNPFPDGSFGGKNFFDGSSDDQSTGSGHPFFKQTDQSRNLFDPRNYKTESGL